MNSGLPDSQSLQFRDALTALGLHVLVAVVLIFRVYLAPPDEALRLESAIRVDIVGLPDKAPPAMEPAPSPVTPQVTKVKDPPAPAPVPEVIKKADIKDIQKAQQDAIRRLEALKKIEAQLQAEKAERQRAEQAKLIKGNAVSDGDAPRGVWRLQADAYISDLDKHIKQHWVLPQWLSQLQLKARAIVKLDADGTVLERKISISSGNDAFDAKVLEAIDSAVPFPAPPERFVGLMKHKGVEFAFPE